MISFRTCAVLLTAVALVISAAPACEAQLYAAPGAGRTDPGDTNLYIIDTSGNIVETVGATGHNITGMDFDPVTGELYATTTPNSSFPDPSSLIRINPDTGAATLVGSYASEGLAVVDITFAPDGTLYGWLQIDGGNTAELVTLNLSTGAATRVGSVATNGVDLNSIGGSGLDMAPDGTLYMFGQAAVGSSGECEVIDVNPATGTYAKVADLVDSKGGGNCYAYTAGTFDDSGVLWAIQTDNTAAKVLTTVDPSTGQVTEIGPTVDYISAIAWRSTNGVPAVSTLGLIALVVLLAGVGLFGLRR